jgi:hypothetical protein
MLEAAVDSGLSQHRSLRRRRSILPHSLSLSQASLTFQDASILYIALSVFHSDPFQLFL